jgi:uncharacterized membrane protein YphA (DoxX/SURF4 family)
MTEPATARVRGPGPLGRFAYRFAAAYLLLYNAAALIGLLPWVGRYSYYVDRLWNHVVLWTEKSVLGMTTLSSLKISGSGDTSFLWARTGCMLSLALPAALAWSFLARDWGRESVLRDLIRISVRYRLAAVLIGYGVAKLVPPGQFPEPGGARLLEPVGRLSPMGMLWVFMGASTPYKMFGGLMEITGGLLLLLRRTTPLGAVVSAGVILNVVLLNFCYDVPVKLFSLNLLLMAGFLAWPDLRRIANVLVLNRAAEPARLDPPWKSARVRAAALALKIAVIGALLYGEYGWMRGSGPEFKPLPASVTELSGIWNVATFRRDGAEVPALITDATRWRRVVFADYPGEKWLIAVGESNQWVGSWQIGPDSSAGKLILRSDTKELTGAPFTYTRQGPDQMTISGTVKDHLLTVELNRADKDDTRLFNRGFHWVSEDPFNR